MGKAFIDRTGFKYAQLTVLSYSAKSENKTKATWRCLCECGNISEVTGNNLVSGHTRSCGCLQIKAMEARRIYAKEHAAEYAVWRSIKQRTSTTAGKNVAWYGHISMCPEWYESFDAFLRDMGKRPGKGFSIERKNNALDYSASNCVWATAQDQANNRRTNHVITFDGETLTVAQWSRRTGIKEHTIAARIRKSGWTPEAALTTPILGKQ